MECHGCKKEIKDNKFKKVGVWNFCDSCFEDLLKKAEDKSSKPQASHGDTPPEIKLPMESSRSGSVKKKCTICEMAIEDDDYFRLGSLTICSTCRQELLARPKPVQINLPEVEEIVAAEPEDIKTKYQDITYCCECKRPIHRVGGKEFDNRLYCPDCFYKNNFHQSN